MVEFLVVPLSYADLNLLQYIIYYNTITQYCIAMGISTTIKNNGNYTKTQSEQFKWMIIIIMVETSLII